MTYSPIIGMKTRMLPVIRPGRAIGSVTWRNVAQRPAPEILRRLDERAVHPLERHVEREHHQRQVAVDEAEQDRDSASRGSGSRCRRSASPMKPGEPVRARGSAARRRSGSGSSSRTG